MRRGRSWERKVLPRHARADGAKDFVRDRLLPRGQISSSNAFLPLLSDEDGVIANGNLWHIGYIGHRHIHTDPSNDRGPSPSDQDGSTV